jgi:uroporphyrinogen decarboxylase
MPDFPPLQNDLMLRAARGEDTERAPVWIMRQAGRYLPEYRALRAEHAFFDVVQTPKLAAEVTLQPIDRFPLDAAIIFSDILVVPQAFGLEVQMKSGVGPHFPAPLDTPAGLDRLDAPDIDVTLGHVFDALTETRMQLNGRVPLIGFCGAPWTLMAYMIQGGGSKNFKKARAWLYQHPEASHDLLQRITDVLIEYLRGQIDAGAQLVQVFDSWAGLLGPGTFQTFGLPYLRQIAKALDASHSNTPSIVFAKGAPYALDALAETPYDVIALDWTMDPREARAIVGDRAVLQGNLDPCALYAPLSDIRAATGEMLNAFGPHGHIANLGHGMHPDHDPEHAGAFIEAVQEQSAQQRSTNPA